VGQDSITRMTATARSAVLRDSGSTALSLSSARLRNLSRPELYSNGTSDSARRPRERTAYVRQVTVPEPASFAMQIRPSLNLIDGSSHLRLGYVS
jgi:hypothetical protein